MTIIAVVLIGGGILLISSALDCTPIVQTFQKIISGQQIDWTGTQNCQGQTPPLQGQSPTAPTTPCTQANNGQISGGWICNNGTWEPLQPVY